MQLLFLVNKSNTCISQKQCLGEWGGEGGVKKTSYHQSQWNKMKQCEASPHRCGTNASVFGHLVEVDWKTELHFGVGQLQRLSQSCGDDMLARCCHGEGLRSRVDDVLDAVPVWGCWGGWERGGGGRRGTQVVDDHGHDKVVCRNLKLRLANGFTVFWSNTCLKHTDTDAWKYRCAHTHSKEYDTHTHRYACIYSCTYPHNTCMHMHMGARTHTHTLTHTYNQWCCLLEKVRHEETQLTSRFMRWTTSSQPDQHTAVKITLFWWTLTLQRAMLIIDEWGRKMSWKTFRRHGHCHNLIRPYIRGISLVLGWYPFIIMCWW